jgi:hypothetical protein
MTWTGRIARNHDAPTRIEELDVESFHIAELAQGEVQFERAR